MTQGVEVHIYTSFTVCVPKVRDKQIETEIRDSGRASSGARNARSHHSEHEKGTSDGTLT